MCIGIILYIIYSSIGKYIYLYRRRERSAAMPRPVDLRGGIMLL